jgi:hypothetical protein
MPTTPSLIDRLRIERAVWTVDTYVQSLPSRSRRAVRRELRNNLRSSAAQVGARDAIRGLGSLRRLSLGYLEAEYGEGRPRPDFLKGVFWAAAVDFVIAAAIVISFESFMDGLEAGGAGAGTYAWSTGKVFGITGEVTFDAKGFTGFWIEWSVLFFVYSSIAFVLGARLWRTVPAWWRRVQRDRAARTAVGR